MNPVCCTVDTCEVSCTTCNCCGTRTRPRSGGSNDENEEEEESTLPLVDDGNNDKVVSTNIIGKEAQQKTTWSTTNSLSSSACDIAPPSDNEKHGSKVSSIPSIFGLGNGCVVNNNEKEEKFYSEEEVQSTGKLQVRRRSSLFKANSCPVIYVNDRRYSIRSDEDLVKSKEKLVRDWLETQNTHVSPYQSLSPLNSPKKSVKSSVKSVKSAASSKNSRENIALAEVFPGLTQEELHPDDESLEDFFGPSCPKTLQPVTKVSPKKKRPIIVDKKMPTNEKPVCRACLKTSFRLKKVTNVDKKLSMTIQTSYSILTGINCTENDQICPKCLKMLVKCSKFIEKCEQSDAKLIAAAMESDTDTDFFDDSSRTISQEETTDTNNEKFNNNVTTTTEEEEEPQTENIDEEISSVCSEMGSCSGDETSRTVETEAQVHSSGGKSVKFNEKLEEVYESDFEECSSETNTETTTSKGTSSLTKKNRGIKRPRLRQRPKRANENDKKLFYFCKVCRRTFPDKYTLQLHLNGTSVYLPGNHIFFDF